MGYGGLGPSCGRCTGRLGAITSNYNVIFGRSRTPFRSDFLGGRRGATCTCSVVGETVRFSTLINIPGVIIRPGRRLGCPRFGSRLQSVGLRFCSSLVPLYGRCGVGVVIRGV